MTYLEITLKIDPKNRDAAAAVYNQFKSAFLQKIAGARSKDLLVRDGDVQVLHGFESNQQAQAYLDGTFFTQDVVKALKPLPETAPEVRIYAAA